MSKERVGDIIGLLGYTKVCSRLVPRMLTPEKKQKHVESCEELLKRYREEGDQFLLNIVTGDESRIHHFDPEEKRLSMQYKYTSTPHPKIFKTVPSAGKILLTVFLGLTKRLHDRNLKAGNTVNSARYIETIKSYGGGCVELDGQHCRFCCCMTMPDRTLLAQRLMLWRL